MVKKDIREIDYQKLQQELDGVLEALQSEDTDIDDAIKLYERGLVIIKELEGYLENAENTVKELKAKFDKKS